MINSTHVKDGEVFGETVLHELLMGRFGECSGGFPISFDLAVDPVVHAALCSIHEQVTMEMNALSRVKTCVGMNEKPLSKMKT